MAKFYNMEDPSEFFCTKCGKKNLLTVARKQGQAREPGHLKRLFCFSCKEEVNHAEVRVNNLNYTYEDFQQEFELGRFVDGQRVHINELYGCSNSKCPFSKYGKCWNANGSNPCSHRPQKGE